MKINHHVAAVAALTTVTALALTGCSGQAGSITSSSSGGALSGTVTGLFDAAYKEPIAKIAAAFEEANPGVKTNFSYQGGDLGSQVLTQLQAGTAPDVLTTFPGGKSTDSADNVIPLATQSRILPIDASWTKDIPSVWASGVTVAGKVYAFPGALQPLSAIYNQTALDKAGLTAPKTLSEVLQFCKDATDKGVYAYAQGLGEVAAGPQMLSFGQLATLLYGKDPTFDQKINDGSAKYTSSAWVEQFKIYKQMNTAGCFGKGALGRTRQQGSDAVAAGKALGIVDVGAVVAGMKTAGPSNTYVITDIPATDDGTSSITALPGYNVSVNAKAKNVAAAKAFVAFLGEKEQSAAWANGFSSVPVIPDTSFAASAELKSFADLVQSNKFAPLANVTSPVQQALNKGIQSLLLGNATPEGVAEQMQKALK